MDEGIDDCLKRTRRREPCDEGPPAFANISVAVSNEPGADNADDEFGDKNRSINEEGQMMG